MAIRVPIDRPRFNGPFYVDYESVRSGLPKQNQHVRWLTPSDSSAVGIYHDGVWILANGKHIDYEPDYWAPLD